MEEPLSTIVSFTFEPNDVIQINKGHKWEGCLAVVDEVRDWGVLAYVPIPHNDGTPTSVAYIRLLHSEARHLGVKAPISWVEDDQKD